MRNLYFTVILVSAIMAFCSSTYAQPSKADSCKFALSAGFLMPPYPAWLYENNYPTFFEVSYYINPKTSIDFSYAGLFYVEQGEFPANRFELDLSLCRHPKLNKWLYLMYGINFEFAYNSDYTVIPANDYGFAAGISFGADIKLYKNLFIVNRTDFGMGPYIYNETSYNGSHFQVFGFALLGTGLKLRF